VAQGSSRHVVVFEQRAERNVLRGSYTVVEEREDGSMMLRPERVDEVIQEFADRPLDEAETEEALRRLHEATLRAEG